VVSFLQSPNSETFEFNADYRYLILPSYVQMNAYTRYNYPNFFYYTGFSSDQVTDFTQVSNELLAEQDPAAVFPLSLASVKDIVVLPENFAQDELQGWRLTGDTRTSGGNLFGDIDTYRNFVNGLNDITLQSGNNLSTFVNERALPRIYLPSVLVQAQGNLKSIFKDLRVLNNVIPLSDFTLINSESNDTGNHNYILNDLKGLNQMKIQIFNCSDLNFSYETEEEENSYMENGIIVWSNQKTISSSDDLINIAREIETEKDYLSIWVKVPPTSLTNTYTINTRLIVSNETVENINLSLLDPDGKTLSANINQTVTPIDEDTVYLDYSITPTLSHPAFFKFPITGESNSMQEITLQKSIKLEKITHLKLDLSNSGTKIDTTGASSFPIVVTRTENETVIWPVETQSDFVEYDFESQFGIDHALLLSISTNKTNSGWSMLNEEVNWLSPTEIFVDLDLFVKGENEGNEIILPLFFGNEYNPSWDIVPSIDSGKINKIEHLIGNGFGNLWLIHIDEISDASLPIYVSIKIQWDNTQLLLYQSCMLFGLTLILLALPLLIFLKKSNRQNQF
jgi:hypothetical protein